MIKILILTFIFNAGIIFAELTSIEKTYPKRIISLGTHLTEQLYLLKSEDRLTANTIYCQNPPEAKNKEKIGTVTTFNIEKIIKLQPDLILATSLSNRQQIEKLKKLGFNVVIFPQAESFDKICEQFLELAKIVGKEKMAQDIVSCSKKRVAHIKNATQNLPKPKVFVQLGTKPLFTVSKDSFIRDFIEFAGGINIAKDIEIGYYSYEKVVESNPDIILIASMGITGEKEKKNWQRYKSINAVRNQKIYVIDSYKICSPTPITFTETLKEISEIFHPELKGKLKYE